MYTWCHLELKKYIGYNGVLNGDTAEEVWNLCNDKLQHDPDVYKRQELNRAIQKLSRQRSNAGSVRRPRVQLMEA